MLLCWVFLFVVVAVRVVVIELVGLCVGFVLVVDIVVMVACIVIVVFAMIVIIVTTLCLLLLWLLFVPLLVFVLLSSGSGFRAEAGLWSCSCFG